MPKILIATHNRAKAKELSAILQPLGLRLLTLGDLMDDIPEPPETGPDFLTNASLKANYYAQMTSLAALADDSGLVVPALDGRPGVRSARYGGDYLTDSERNDYLLKEMAAVSDRRASFQVVLVLAKPSNGHLFWTGEVEGLVTHKPMGSAGFGYDPLFFVPEFNLTMAQMTSEAKNKISHRAQAAEALKRDLAKIRLFLGD
jgi:XTP/dITP diphosphohydrolase